MHSVLDAPPRYRHDCRRPAGAPAHGVAALEHRERGHLRIGLACIAWGRQSRSLLAFRCCPNERSALRQNTLLCLAHPLPGFVWRKTQRTMSPSRFRYAMYAPTPRRRGPREAPIVKSMHNGGVTAGDMSGAPVVVYALSVARRNRAVPIPMRRRPLDHPYFVRFSQRRFPHRSILRLRPACGPSQLVMLPAPWLPEGFGHAKQAPLSKFRVRIALQMPESALSI